jgi:MoCo/4Fe-4S cofactor protein with predicted Tat translocation signal
MSNGKTYWKGIEEKEQTESFIDAAKNEFPQELSTQEFLSNNELTETSTNRRDFLKFMGFSVAAATLAACEAPVIKSVPYVNKPEEITPGVANWYASTYWDGNDYASILVKTREGRPIFIKGNKEYGINQGATTPRIIGSVLPLYSGARLKNPTVNVNESTWSIVDTNIAKELKAIKDKGGKVRILTNTISSPSTEKAINEFTSSLAGISEEGTGKLEVKHITYDAVSNSGMLMANKNTLGKAIVPDYHFDKARVIVSINADFLTNWLLSTDYMPDYLKTRNPEGNWMSRHFQYESVMSTTGSNADVRVPIKPSQEGLIAAALHQHIVGKVSGVNIPNDILKATEAAANELKANKGESLVVAGANCEGTQTVINAINKALGNYGATIDTNNAVHITKGIDSEVEQLVKEIEAGEVDALFMYNVNPVYTLPNGQAFANTLAKVGLTVSFSQYADETASKCKYVCPDNHFLESWNDYSIKDDNYAIAQPVIRPLHNTASAQESFLVWSGKATRGGKDSTVYHDYIKSSYVGEEDSFFWDRLVHNGSEDIRVVYKSGTEPVFSFNADLAKAGKLIDIQAKNIANSADGYEVVVYQKNGIGDGQHSANPWLQELPDPITKVTWDNYITMSRTDAEKNEFNIILGQESPASLATVTVNGKSLTLPVFVLPGQAVGTLGVALGYGRGANQENIGESAYQTKEYGDHIIDAEGNKQLIGQNAYSLAKFSNGNIVSGGVAILEDAKGTFPLAATQTHHTFMGRTSIVRETTFDVYKAGNKKDFNKDHTLVAHEKGKTVDKNIREFDLWDPHPVENVGHRWGLSIDLNSCIGCGTCIVACNIENNVPVVGKDEIRRGRDLHWLRLDRYFSSAEQEVREGTTNYKERRFENTKTGVAENISIDSTSKIAMLLENEDYLEITDYSYAKLEIPEDNPQVVHMPMMCQHCNHAPCETVCPVAATTHSNEGLNQMTYNRCIGTRYCANNCPYKVRRFNWFNYPTNKRFNHFNPSQMDLGRMVLNPDVTVRSRGVMEKCSMCVQQIQAGKLEAKKAGEVLKDGAIQTACSSSCPTNAITFGDLNDFKSNEGKGSVIRQKADGDRAYHVLEEIGTQPNVYYHVKVRNTNEG